jgi:hypothetical protein
MEIEMIKLFRDKYFHIYSKICGFLNIFPVRKGQGSFYPMTCASCPQFDNRAIIFVFRTKFKDCKYTIRGFCSSFCFKKFRERTDKFDVGNYLKLKKWKETPLKGFEDDFGELASKKLISIPEKLDTPIIKYQWNKKECVKVVKGRIVYFQDFIVNQVELTSDTKIDPINLIF